MGGQTTTPAPPAPFTYRAVAYIVGVNVFFIASTAPAFWGKVNLQSLLFRNGAFEDLCTPENPPVCEAQRIAISEVFTTSVAFFKVSGIILGPLIDIAGPKMTGIVGQTLFGISILLMAQGWVYPGFMTMGASMNPIFNSTLSSSNLLPRRRNFVMSLLSSGGDAGYITFYILKRIQEATQLTVPTVFYGYFILVVFQLLVALFLFPRWPYTMHQSPEYVSEMDPLRHPSNRFVKKSAGRATLTQQWKKQMLGRKADNYHEMTLKQQLATPHIWLFLPMFCLFFFRKVMFNDSVADYLMNIPNVSHRDVDDMVAWFSIVQALGFIWAWFFGILADRVGVTIVLFIVNLVGICVSIFSLIPSLQVQMLTFIFFAMFKGYTISSAYAFVSENYGYSHLGTLTGFLQIVGGVCVLLYRPFRRWTGESLDGNWKIPNLIVLALSVVCMLVPVYMWYNPAPVPHAPPHVRRKGTSIFSTRYTPGFRCLSAGPMFTEMDVPICGRCREFECRCSVDMYCIGEGECEGEDLPRTCEKRSASFAVSLND